MLDKIIVPAVCGKGVDSLTEAAVTSLRHQASAILLGLDPWEWGSYTGLRPTHHTYDGALDVCPAPLALLLLHDRYPAAIALLLCYVYS